jgi:hypothetical protein
MVNDSVGALHVALAAAVVGWLVFIFLTPSRFGKSGTPTESFVLLAACSTLDYSGFFLFPRNLLFRPREHALVLRPGWQSCESGSVGCRCHSRQCHVGKLVCRGPPGLCLFVFAFPALRFLSGYAFELCLVHRHVRPGERLKNAMVRASADSS